MTTAARAPLLDLDTLIERPFIRIDEAAYDLRSPGELSVFASAQLQRWGQRMQQLQGESTEEALAELDELVGKIARAVMVDIPDEVFAKLSGEHRMAIIEVFTGLRLRETLKVAGAIKTAVGTVPENLIGLTGGSTFRGLSGSTAARRQTGFIARLRRWFGRS